MAQFGRSYPAPTRRIGPNYRGVAPTISLSSFSLSWSFPALSVVSPSVSIPLGAFTRSWSFPALSLPIALSSFSLSWSWPTITAFVPPAPGDALTGENGQVEWNGFLLGAGTSYRVQQIDGWRGLPAINNTNVERPNRHGAWDSRKLAQQRIVTIKLRLDSATDPAQIDSLLDQLDAATGIPEDDLPLPLVIKGYGDPQLAFGHVIDRDISMDGDWSVGQPSAALLIACGDPRRFGLLRHGITVPKDTPTSIANAGNTATHPVLRIPGPVANPLVANITLDRVLQFNITLAEGERLDIDADAGNVMVGTSNQMSTLTGSSVPVSDWVLGAGSNTILYTAETGGSEGLDVLWRDASL